VIVPTVYNGEKAFLQLETILAELHLPPNSLPIFVAGAILYNNLGFHDALLAPSGSGVGGQTYIYTWYPPHRLFGIYGQGDTAVLSHEVAEWLMDPFLLNSTPGWNMPWLQTDQCNSQAFNDALEVSDVLALSKPDSIISLPGTHTYHVQDSVFLDFFTRQSPSRSVNGYYSMFNVAQGPSGPCQGHLEFAYNYFAYPGSRWSEAHGINNRDQIVGFYRDAVDNLDHGFLLEGGRFRKLDYPGAVATYASKINDGGLIVGYYFDGSGGLHGFSYNRGNYMSIDVPGAIDTYAEGLNSRGEVVGGFDDVNFVTHGFIFRNGIFETVESPFAANAQLTSIDDRGRLTGYTLANALGGESGFVRSGSGFVTTNFPNSIHTEPLALNSSNVLSGLFYNASICECLANWSGFVTVGDYRRGQYRYIKGWTNGSNDRGEIVGSDGAEAFVARLP
jgi:hypothetical protein